MPEESAAIATRQGGLIQTTTNADIERREQVERDQRKAEQEQQQPAILSLASHIQKAWESAKQGKIQVETRLLKCMRQRNGEYDPDVKAQLQKHGGSDIFMMITSMKCRSAEAWLKDVLLPAGEKPWGIDPTPKPELPPHIEEQIEELVMYEVTQIIAQNGIEAVSVEQVRDRLQEVRNEVLKEQIEIARETTARLETHIEDELREGGFYQQVEKFISDLVTYPAAFLKGPITRMRKTLTWDYDEDNLVIPKVGQRLRREYEWVSPFDMYPSKGAKSVQDGDLIERLRLRRSHLEEMKGVPGYNSKAIDAVLWLYGQGGLREWLWTDQERAEQESRPHMMEETEALIDGVLYWGNAQGKQLREWGMSDKQVPNLHKDYQVVALLIGNFLIMAQLNPHPLGHRPYYSASYENMNNSIWGKSPPELMADNQRMCNAAGRSLINNMAISSGPLVEVHIDRLQPGEDIEDLFPWKIIKTKRDEQGQRDGPAVYFYQPSSNAEQLLRVYQYWFDQSSEVTGIPSYFQGSGQNVGGAGKTASGLSMLLNAATKTLKGVVFNVDFGMTMPAIKEHWLQLMLYEDMDKTGDINVIARASEYLLIQEQLQVRLQEYLNVTNNPTDLAIMGLPGRAELLRQSVKFLKVPRAEKIIPPEEVFLEAQQQQQEAQQDLAGQTGQQPNMPRSTALSPAGYPAGGDYTQEMPMRMSRVK